jgi:hypothetical protein
VEVVEVVVMILSRVALLVLWEAVVAVVRV